jgi:hypothetical protein
MTLYQQKLTYWNTCVKYAWRANEDNGFVICHQLFKCRSYIDKAVILIYLNQYNMDKIFVSIYDFTSETGLKEGRQTLNCYGSKSKFTH